MARRPHLRLAPLGDAARTATLPTARYPDPCRYCAGTKVIWFPSGCECGPIQLRCYWCDTGGLDGVATWAAWP